MVSYNEAKYLTQAIESCLGQDLTEDFEIIIGDDGSSDGSIELIREYARRYPEKIRYYVMERNNPVNVIASLRVSNVIKRGLALAKGEYVTVLSGDDFFLDAGKSRRQIAFLDGHRKYSCCYTDYEMFWDDGEKESMCCAGWGGNSMFWAFYYSHVSTFLIRTEAARQTLDRFCDDTGLIFTAFCGGKSAYLPGVTFGYRQRDKSIMHEADSMELMILELMLFQDILNQGGYAFSSLSRFLRPLRGVFRRREELKNPKYGKYMENCAGYPHNLLGELAGYDEKGPWQKLKIRLLLAASRLAHVVFRVARKVYGMSGVKN